MAKKLDSAWLQGIPLAMNKPDLAVNPDAPSMLARPMNEMEVPAPTKQTSLPMPSRAPAQAETPQAPQTPMQAPMDPEQEILGMYLDQIRKGKTRADEANQELQNMPKRQSGISEVNWSPLARLIGMEGYEAPTAQSEHDEKKLLKAAARDKAENQNTADQLAYLKMKADARKAEEDRALRRALDGGRDSRFLEGQDNKFMLEQKKGLDKLIDPVIMESRAIGQAQEAITSGEPTRIMGTMSIIARVVNGERGALSNDDVSRTMAANVNLELAKLQNFVSSNPNARVPDGIIKPLQASLDAFKRQAEQTAKVMLENHKKSWLATGKNPQFVEEIAGGKAQMLQGAYPDQNPPPPSGVPTIAVGFKDPTSGLTFQGGAVNDQNNWK